MLSASAVPRAPLHSHPRAFLLYSLCTGWYVRRRSPPSDTGMDESGPCPSPGRESSAQGQPPAAAPVLTPGSGRARTQPQAPQHGPGSAPAPALQQRLSEKTKLQAAPFWECNQRDAGAESAPPEAALSFEAKKATSPF